MHYSHREQVGIINIILCMYILSERYFDRVTDRMYSVFFIENRSNYKNEVVGENNSNFNVNHKRLGSW